MDFFFFKQDSDELIYEFVESELTTLADMKRVWLFRKFSYIYEAGPSNNLSFFMQSLYAHTIRVLKKLKDCVVEAKDNGIRVVVALVKRMLEKNMFLFGFVDLSEGSVTEMFNQLTKLLSTHIKLAYEKLFASTRIDHFLLMDLSKEVDLDVLKKMSTEYTGLKKRGIEEASEVIDVQTIKHILDNKESIGDVVEKITEN